MLEMVEKAFAPELLSVSSKAAMLVDFAWTIRNIGGAVPINVVEGQFPKAEDYVSALSKAGVLRYAMGGFINREQRKQSLSISLNEPLLRISSPGIRRKEFENALFRNHRDRMIENCRTGLTEPLVVMLTSILFYATPERPVFSNTIVRRTAKVSMKTHFECQNILDYYLYRFLGLVTIESGSLINLSVRSVQRVRMYPKLWDMYVRTYQEKPKEVEVIRSPVSVSPARPTTGKANEQEKRLRGYFPWLKL
jgi:hypothetical protein